MIIGHRVKHKKFNLGTVTSITHDFFTVMFDETIDGNDTRSFSYQSISSDFELLNEDALVELLRAKGCEGLFHMTDIMNLKKIIHDEKLYSRLHPKNQSVIDSANPHVIQHTNDKYKQFVRFYYKEKTPTYYNMEGILKEKTQGHIPIPCLLIFNLDITKLQPSRLANGNVSSVYTKVRDTHLSILDGYIYDMPWDRILGRGYYENEDYAEETRVRNAEFLIKDEVSLHMVDKIIFRSGCELEYAKKICPDLARYETECVKEYFNNIGLFTSKSVGNGYNIRLFFDDIDIDYQDHNLVVNMYTDVAFGYLSKFNIGISFINERKELVNQENLISSTQYSPYRFNLYSSVKPVRVKIYIDGIIYYIWER